MNLSHPEQYLAPILSAMEREGGEIPLHGGDAGAYGVPQAISYPGNLVIIGTVNMDETTMGVSDKVLDRAFTLEFWDIDVGAWAGMGVEFLAGGEQTGGAGGSRRHHDRAQPRAAALRLEGDRGGRAVPGTAGRTKAPISRWTRRSIG